MDKLLIDKEETLALDGLTLIEAADHLRGLSRCYPDNAEICITAHDWSEYGETFSDFSCVIMYQELESDEEYSKRISDRQLNDNYTEFYNEVLGEYPELQGNVPDAHGIIQLYRAGVFNFRTENNIMGILHKWSIK